MVEELNSPMATITGEKEKKKKLLELVDYELGNGTNIAVLRSNFFVSGLISK